MATTRIKMLALLSGAIIGMTSAVYAQDNSALLDALVKKGVLSTDDAKQIQADAKKAQAQSATTIAGKLFIDVSSIDAKLADGTKSNTSGVGVDVKRFYLGATHQFNNVWSANINTDSSYSSATGTTSVFIKTAYVQAKLAPEAIVQVGSAGQPWIPFVEDNYGLRYVENTFTDRLHVGNSADWGVHFLGTSGIVSYNIAAVEGGGYKNPTRSKSMDFEGRLSVEPIKGLVFAVGGYTGDLGKNLQTTPAKQTANRYDAMVSYKIQQFKIGAEYFSEKNWGLTASSTPDKGDGYSVWGQYNIDKMWSVFARYDADKMSKDINPNLKDTYYNLGVQCAVIKGVDVSLVYKKDKIDKPTSNSTVTDYNEIGVFAQVAF